MTGFLIPLGDDLFLRGDDILFVITKKTSPVAHCGTLGVVPPSYQRLMPNGQSSALINDLALAYTAIERKIEALSKYKMIDRLELEDKYFIVFDRDSFNLERTRPARTDKSKNFGNWGQWHLHLALAAYADQMIRHSDITDYAGAMRQLDNIFIGIEAAISITGLRDQGSPAIISSRNIPVTQKGKDPTRPVAKLQTF